MDRTVTALTVARPADGVAARTVRNAVVLDHLDVAEALATRYGARRSDFADIRQVACIGLMKAAERFDSTKGLDFVAFAVPTIRGEIMRYLRDHGWLVRPPRHLQEIRAAAVHVLDDFPQGDGQPTAADLADRIGCSVSEVLAAQRLPDDRHLVSLDMPAAGSEGVPLGQLLAVDDPGFDAVDRAAELQSVLDGLGPRDREVLRLRFSEELSQQEIGRRIGVTQMQVSRILNRLLVHLREALGGSADPAALVSPRDDERRLSA